MGGTRRDFLRGTVGLAALSRLDASTNKPHLVRAVNDHLVWAAGRRRKTGFSFPFDGWMKRHSGELREMAMRSPYLDRREASRLWSAFDGNRLHWSRAWGLVVLGGRNG